MPNSQTVLELIRRAMHSGDSATMREALQLLLGSGQETLSPAAEYEVRHEDYVMEMPQSGERIRGREAMRRMQEGFPNPPSMSIRRVVGADRIWVLEGVNDYGDDLWHGETRYYAQPFQAPEWRSPFVELI